MDKIVLENPPKEKLNVSQPTPPSIPNRSLKPNLYYNYNLDQQIAILI